jgi:hypothetical protein
MLYQQKQPFLQSHVEIVPAFLEDHEMRLPKATTFQQEANSLYALELPL